MAKKSITERLYSNNIVLMVSSLLIAFVIWFVINANSQTDTNVTISDIPITIELPEDSVKDGLMVFSGADTTASVEVSGNRLTVGSLKNTDIQVVALQSNSIIAPGNYSLELSAKKAGVRTNYNIVSDVSPSVVSIFVDKNKEKTFDIKDEIVYKVDDGYYPASSLSETSVTISGPESKISTIDKVVVQGNLEGDLGDTVTESMNLVFLDKDGNRVDTGMCVCTTEFVDVTLTVMPTAEVTLTVDVANAPKNYPKISLNPNRIKIAADQDTLKSIKNSVINIGTVDFSKLRNEKVSLNYDIALPTGCKNLSNVTSTKVTVDLSKYESKNVTLTDFEVRNLDASKYIATFNSKGLDVTVYGPKDTVDSITAKNIVAYVEANLDEQKDGAMDSLSIELPFKFEMRGAYKTCWVYGDYTDIVNIKKK